MSACPRQSGRGSMHPVALMGMLAYMYLLGVENHVLILLRLFHFQFSQFLDLLLIKTPCKDCFPSLAKNQKINVIVKT